MQNVYYRPLDYKQKALELFTDNIKPDRSNDDLLSQVMLDWGLPLSLKIEQLDIAGKQVFKVAANSLYACFDKGIDQEFGGAIVGQVVESVERYGVIDLGCRPSVDTERLGLATFLDGSERRIRNDGIRRLLDLPRLAGIFLRHLEAEFL